MKSSDNTGELFLSIRRRNNIFWEPIFDKNIKGPFNEGMWNLDENDKVERCVYHPEYEKTTTRVLTGVTFDEVDFEGDYKYRLVFKECTFKKCDFAYSTFRRAKFTNCHFIESTFSFCYLYDCELRDCTYQKIGFSGNETILEKTLITNPIDFISGAHTNLENIPPDVSKYIQKQRLEITKSTLARILLSAMSHEGSEQNYYDGIKISTIQECKAKKARYLIEIKDAYESSLAPFFKLLKVIRGGIGVVGAVLDLVVLKIFGFINAWGSSLSRPVSIGVFLILLFGYYYHATQDTNIFYGVQKSTELFLLFGYTKYSVFPSELPLLIQASHFLNAVLGVIWYVVTIPTIVNKLTRVRS